MNFLWLVITAPAWFYIVLIFCAVTARLAYGIRALTAPSAWVMLALFFVWVAASNSWHFLAQPDATQFDKPDALAEAWRMWAVHLYELLIFAYLMAGAVTTAVAAWIAWGAYTGRVRITMLTVFYGFMIFVGQVGEAMQRYVCKTNDLWVGREHLYRLYGGEGREACERIVADVLQIPWGETIGPLFFPVLTVLPLPVILWWTRRKAKAVTVR